jgi:MFS family permease
LERANTYTEAVRVNGFMLSIFRASFGLIMFLSLFSLRDAPLWWSGLTLGALSSGTSFGALIADRLRRRFDESRIIIGAAIGIGIVAAGCAVDGGRFVGAVVAGVIGLASSIARLAFDSIVQRDQPVAGQGAAFARFETRFQLAWVLGALLATALEPPRYVGLIIIAVGMVAAVVVGVIGEPALEWMISVRAKMVAQIFRRKRQTT